MICSFSTVLTEIGAFYFSKEIKSSVQVYPPMDPVMVLSYLLVIHKDASY